MKILAYRFSSFGDVALVVPALRTLLEENEALEIHFASRPVFEPLFNDLPRFHYHAIDLTNYSGLFGLSRLYDELKVLEDWDFVIDLHGVLRTWTLDFFFQRGGFTVLKIDKGRDAKEKLTRKKRKELTQLTHATQRYLDAFSATGLASKWTNEGSIHTKVLEKDRATLRTFISDRNVPSDNAWIAVAPFSKHIQKEWPFEKIEELVQKMTREGYVVFLFGAGEEETSKLNRLERNSTVINVADQLSLNEELALLEQIQVMVSMDSFNMHLSSLVGVKVVSIWGATHPYAGFGPGKSNEPYMVQRSDLACRPCSVFGDKSCYRGDLACLDISVDEVYTMVEKALK